jgi:adiponectin receptor
MEVAYQVVRPKWCSTNDLAPPVSLSTVYDFLFSKLIPQHTVQYAHRSEHPDNNISQLPGGISTSPIPLSAPHKRPTKRHTSMSIMTWSYPTALLRHRPHCASYLECAKSIWKLHDEAVNIWTHLFAAAVFCTVTVGVLSRRGRKHMDRARAASLYFPAATLYFLCSTLCHIFADHDTAPFWRCLDHCSITAFIWASSRSFAILACTSKQTAPRLYATILTAGGLGLVVWTLCADAAGSNRTMMSIVTHTAYGSFAAVPALARPTGLHWRATTARKRLLEKFQALILISAIGGALYTTRLIETVLSARADCGDVGHQAMHMAVVVGACIFGQELLHDDPHSD